MSRTRIELLDSEECLRLLGSARVGRIGITVSALPVVLPVNFALFDTDVVFRSTARTKLTAAATGAVVAFEADAYSDDGFDAWVSTCSG
jgi:nitroimidazol reductase NimA-like FMN-containing flavoprotein (pyridoxamine 5'-phosphate oxidase superfamily)